MLTLPLCLQIFYRRRIPCITSFSHLIIHPRSTFRYYQSSCKYDLGIQLPYSARYHVVEVCTSNHITDDPTFETSICTCL